MAAGMALLLTAGLAACAPQQQSAPPAASTQGMSGMQGMQGHNMSGMQGHSMAGMDHQAMMAHCAQMRQQGGRMTPEMQQMMAQCTQMDRSMSAPPAR